MNTIVVLFLITVRIILWYRESELIQGHRLVGHVMMKQMMTAPGMGMSVMIVMVVHSHIDRLLGHRLALNCRDIHMRSSTDSIGSRRPRPGFA